MVRPPQTKWEKNYARIHDALQERAYTLGLLHGIRRFEQRLTGEEQHKYTEFIDLSTWDYKYKIRSLDKELDNRRKLADEFHKKLFS